jgi:hypothetical protein
MNAGGPAEDADDRREPVKVVRDEDGEITSVTPEPGDNETGHDPTAITYLRSQAADGVWLLEEGAYLRYVIVSETGRDGDGPERTRYERRLKNAMDIADGFGLGSKSDVIVMVDAHGFLEEPEELD